MSAPARIVTNYFASSRPQGVCPNCRGNGQVIYDNQSGDELCRTCGMVLQACMLSEEQEWRSFQGDSGGQEKSRVGGPNNIWLEDGIQGTSMIGGDKRMLQVHEMATTLSGNDRLIKSAFDNLRRVAERYSLRENVVERCKEMIKALANGDNLSKRTNEKNMLALVYIACKESSVSRTLKELTSGRPDITHQELGRAVNRLKKLMPARALGSTQSAAELMPRLCNKLDLSAQVESIAQYVAKKAELTLARVPRPSTLAAAVIYLVVQNLAVDHLTMAAICQKAEVAESTVRDLLKDLEVNEKMLFPPEFKSKKRNGPGPGPAGTKPESSLSGMGGGYGPSSSSSSYTVKQQPMGGSMFAR